MKKLLTIIIGFTFALPVFAQAATFVVAPTKDTYAVGDTIKVVVSVDPKNTTVYTAMLDARFSADTLEVVSFSPNGDMLPLKQGGYDVVDNVAGVLVKTGGYPGGVNGATPFGTLVLRAKTAGAGTFTVGDNSKILDQNNGDQQSGTQTTSFTITSVKEVAVVPAPTNNAEAGKEVAKTTTPGLLVIDGVASSEGNVATSSIARTQLAAVADFVASNSLILIILALFALAIGYRYYTNKQTVK